ncbi:DUF5820 family protein [Haloarculaceae archaeon H-GB2-1]|nr:DUF5820 family protein [Haloarculaceae archaeon H-GB1-1]MEA5386393.1 DUF5820 family protein [Haloarculaceae archaeon H-GB11]MEA5407903.1 DUF5820 family protein [Haloarculaceae archaeon H-GB2-1]
MSFDSLPEGWVVWSDEPQQSVLTFRPDVFDTHSFPAPCLPTIYLTKGRRRRQPGTQTRPTDPWFVTLYLEPEVDRSPERYDSRAAAVEGACELASQFARGEIDYRDLYQVPRPEYFEKLDEITGREA